MKDVYAILRSIRAQRFSRNRNFDAHRSPESAEARRLNRFLRGVERDLRSAHAVTVRPHGAGLRIEMAFPAVRLVRAVVLGVEDVAVLAEDPRVAERLGVRRAAL